MTGSLNLTGFDFVIIGILVLFTFRGLWVGFRSEERRVGKEC